MCVSARDHGHSVGNDIGERVSPIYPLKMRGGWHILSSASVQHFKFQAIQSPNKSLTQTPVTKRQ